MAMQGTTIWFILVWQADFENENENENFTTQNKENNCQIKWT